MLMSARWQIPARESEGERLSYALKNLPRLIVSNSLRLIGFAGVCSLQSRLEGVEGMLLGTCAGPAQSIMEPLWSFHQAAIPRFSRRFSGITSATADMAGDP